MKTNEFIMKYFLFLANLSLGAEFLNKEEISKSLQEKNCKKNFSLEIVTDFDTNNFFQ